MVMNDTDTSVASERPIVALSTVDNPYDPIDDFDHWLSYDLLYGYNCSEILSRLAFTSEQLSDKENDEIIESAIDDLIESDPLNLFVKVKHVKNPLLK